MIDPKRDGKRTSFYLWDEDVARIERLRAKGYTQSSAIRVGLRLLERQFTGQPNAVEACRMARGYVNETNPGGVAALDAINSALEALERGE